MITSTPIPTSIPNNVLIPLDYLVLDRVSTFYNNAWGMLTGAIAIFIGLISLFGVLLPYLMYLKYKKTLKDEKKNIIKQLNIEISKAKNEFNIISTNVQDEMYLGMDALWSTQSGLLCSEKQYGLSAATVITSIIIGLRVKNPPSDLRIKDKFDVLKDTIILITNKDEKNNILNLLNKLQKEPGAEKFYDDIEGIIYMLSLD